MQHWYDRKEMGKTICMEYKYDYATWTRLLHGAVWGKDYKKMVCFRPRADIVASFTENQYELPSCFFSLNFMSIFIFPRNAWFTINYTGFISMLRDLIH